jgi:hypothetical protein
MKMHKIVIPVESDTKAKLNQMRKKGFTITGFVRRALRDVKVPKRRVA